MATKEEVVKQFDGAMVTDGWVDTTPKLKLVAAMLKVQATITDVVKTATNPHFKSGYATLEDVVTLCRPLLTDNDILLRQPCVVGGVATIFTHKSGESFISFFAIPPQDNPQKMGAWITYGRRYTLKGLLGIAEIDDDGNTAARQPRAADTRTSPATRSGIPLSKIKALEARLDAATAEELQMPENKEGFEKYIQGWGEVAAEMRNYRLKKLQEKLNDH